LLLWLLKKISMKFFMNQSQESLRKNPWGSIAMLWLWSNRCKNLRTLSIC
jgi:hypothetical protein